MKTIATLTGLTIGDALGAPFEFCSAEKIAELNWDGEYKETTLWERPLGPGQWTDDSKMALSLAQSLVTNAEFIPARVANKYLRWYQSGDHRGIGTQTSRALSKLALGGSDWMNSGTIPQSNTPPIGKIKSSDVQNGCGNGTVMRIAPLGLFYRHDFAKLYEFARKDAIITHNHPDAINGNIALAYMIAELTGPVKQDLYSIVDDAVNTIDNGNVKNALRDAVGLAKYSKSWQEAINELGDTGAAHNTLASAVFCLLRYDNFTSTLLNSIRMGGDTDSRGAVVGALAGTYYGLESIPDKYLDQLELKDLILALDKLLSIGPDELFLAKKNDNI